MFNPYAPSNKNTTIEKCFRKHQLEKKRAYDQRVREIEHASFTPLASSISKRRVFQGSYTFLQEIAIPFSREMGPFLYNQTMNWLRCTIPFALLRSAIQCVRGARSSRGHAVKAIFSPVDLVVAEANILSC